MQNDLPLIQVEVTAKFKRNLRILAKKYRSIRSDIQPVIEQLKYFSALHQKNKQARLVYLN